MKNFKKIMCFTEGENVSNVETKVNEIIKSKNREHCINNINVVKNIVSRIKTKELSHKDYSFFVETKTGVSEFTVDKNGVCNDDILGLND